MVAHLLALPLCVILGSFVCGLQKLTDLYALRLDNDI